MSRLAVVTRLPRGSSFYVYNYFATEEVHPAAQGVRELPAAARRLELPAARRDDRRRARQPRRHRLPDLRLPARRTARHVGVYVGYHESQVRARGRRLRRAARSIRRSTACRARAGTSSPAKVAGSTLPGLPRRRATREPARDRQGRRAPARLLLVPGARPRDRRRLDEDRLAVLGSRAAPAHRRLAGALHDPIFHDDEAGRRADTSTTWRDELLPRLPPMSRTRSRAGSDAHGRYSALHGTGRLSPAAAVPPARALSGARLPARRRSSPATASTRASATLLARARLRRGPLRHRRPGRRSRTWCSPGGTVVLKPNFVRHFHEKRRLARRRRDAPAVLRPLVDYALEGGRTGRPRDRRRRTAVRLRRRRDARRARGCPSCCAWYRRRGRRVASSGATCASQFGRHEHGVVSREAARSPATRGLRGRRPRRRRASSPRCRRASSRLLRGADYDEEVTIRHHSAGRNEYLVVAHRPRRGPRDQRAEDQDAQEDRRHAVDEEPDRHQRRQELAAALPRGLRGRRRRRVPAPRRLRATAPRRRRHRAPAAEARHRRCRVPPRCAARGRRRPRRRARATATGGATTRSGAPRSTSTRCSTAATPRRARQPRPARAERLRRHRRRRGRRADGARRRGRSACSRPARTASPPTS